MSRKVVLACDDHSGLACWQSVSSAVVLLFYSSVSLSWLNHCPSYFFMIAESYQSFLLFLFLYFLFYFSFLYFLFFIFYFFFLFFIFFFFFLLFLFLLIFFSFIFVYKTLGT